MKIFDFDKFLDTFTGYIETKLELFKIDLKEEISALLAKAIVYVLISMLGVLALVFALGALANWLNEILQSRFLGYLLVCAIIAIAAGLTYSMRSDFQQRILKKLTEADSTSQEEDE